MCIYHPTIERFASYFPYQSEWRLERILGCGAFGVVGKIYRITEGNRFESALKMVTYPQSQQLEQLRTNGYSQEQISVYLKEQIGGLVKEFEILNKLKGHSNFISYEDHSIIANSNETEWDSFLRMELAIPLLEWLPQKNITRRMLIQLALDLCRALETCEAESIIHRDIKEQNIFVSKYGTFKLGDFGVSKVMDNRYSGTIVGTPLYIAPELFQRKAYDRRGDIYSLGIVLYKLFNELKPPFLIDNNFEEAISVRINGQTPLSSPKNAGAQLSEIILKACQYERENRFQNAEEMRMAFEEAQQNMSAQDLQETISFTFSPGEQTQYIFPTQVAKIIAREKSDDLTLLIPESILSLSELLTRIRSSIPNVTRNLASLPDAIKLKERVASIIRKTEVIANSNNPKAASSSVVDQLIHSQLQDLSTRLDFMANGSEKNVSHEIFSFLSKIQSTIEEKEHNNVKRK